MIIAFIGPTYAGKTTMTDAMAAKLRCIQFSPGKLCRRRFGAGTMAQAENPLAPEQAEEFVRKSFRAHYCSAVAQGIPLVMDGFPRSAEQVELMLKFNRLHGPRQMLVLALRVSQKEQARRMQMRDGGDSEAYALGRARLGIDRQELAATMGALQGREGVHVMDVAGV